MFTLWNGIILAFCIFVGLIALFIGWALNAAQKGLDRTWERDEKAYREAIQRWPP